MPGGRALAFENVQTRGTTEACASTESNAICEVERARFGGGSLWSLSPDAPRRPHCSPLFKRVQEGGYDCARILRIQRSCEVVRAVVQRVQEASVSVNGQKVSHISQGLLVYLGVHASDQNADADYLAEKILGLRIFEDEVEKMNLSLTQVQGALLVVSQFTLYGDCRRGKRPSFSEAAPPERARDLYEYFVSKCSQMGVSTQTGLFREMMQVGSVNAGPVTILLDSHKRF